MIKLDEALELINNLPVQPKVVQVDITGSLGMVLAEDIFSDVNMPPFNKSAMDGYACRLPDIGASLKVVDYIPAGVLPKVEINKGECAKIMTGAKIPEGADCVLMVEYTEEVNDDRIRFTGKNTKSNICYIGEDVKEGDKVLSKGDIVNPASMATAASVGKTTLNVYQPPQIGILSTGDELVEIGVKPEGAFIRNSNSYNLLAQAKQTPATVNYIGIVADTKEALGAAITSALENNDILILSGGVSMGDKDFVPVMLKELGMSSVFSKIATQPGRPIAFFHGNGKYCFGLAGNPVSTVLQFEIVVKPFIYHFMDHEYQLPFVKMKLKKGKSRKKTDRMQFFPVQLLNGEAYPIEYHGSAHISGLVNANGLGTFDIGKDTIKENEEVKVLIFK